MLIAAAVLLTDCSPRKAEHVTAPPESRALVGGGWTVHLGSTLRGVAEDDSGNVYVCGRQGSDVLVAKFAPGVTELWRRVIGGSSDEGGAGIAVDAGGIYVTGATASTDFPTTPGAFRRSKSFNYDGFAMKLDHDGATLYSTYLGGNGLDQPHAIAVDGGNAVVAGITGSTTFPTTAGVIKPSRYPTLGDGSDGFITKLNAAGSGLVYSTYFGVDGSSDQVWGLALDAAGQPTVTGFTGSKRFPLTAGAYDREFGYYKEGFAARLNATASALVFSTFIGGANADEGRAVVVDAAGNSYVGGNVGSLDFAAPEGSFGGWDAFIVVLTPVGGLISARRIGTPSQDKVWAISLGTAPRVGGQTFAGGLFGFVGTPDEHYGQLVYGLSEHFAVGNDGTRGFLTRL